jgi:NAD(P)-dependent dehydrogenase (short-subunit alcohol dehydrogenase family)
MNANSKKIVITGGSKGLGKALALEFAKQGSQVLIIGRSEELLKEVSKSLDNIQYVAADVSNKDNIYKLSGAIGATLGSPDIVIQCASYLGQTPLRLLADTDCEEFEKVLQTNLLAPFRLTKALLGSMVTGGGGVFVNLSSDAAINNYETWGCYSISKIAIDRLSGIFDEETRALNVRHLALDPGDMATDMHFAAIPDANRADLHKPEDVAKEMIQFLLNGFFAQSRFTANEWRKAIK